MRDIPALDLIEYIQVITGAKSFIEFGDFIHVVFTLKGRSLTLVLQETADDYFSISDKLATFKLRDYIDIEDLMEWLVTGRDYCKSA